MTSDFSSREIPGAGAGTRADLATPAAPDLATAVKVVTGVAEQVLELSEGGDLRSVQPEAAGDEIVGAALGAGGGEVALVRGAQAQVERGGGQRQQEGRCADGVRHRMP